MDTWPNHMGNVFRKIEWLPNRQLYPWQQEIISSLKANIPPSIQPLVDQYNMSTTTKNKTKKQKQIKMNRQVIATGHVAGLQFHDYAPGLIKVTPLPLELYHERNNAYDPRAIAIYITVDGTPHKLGYVSKNVHQTLWKHKEMGHKISACVTKHDKEQPLWFRLAVEYSIEVPAEPVLEKF